MFMMNENVKPAKGMNEIPYSWEIITSIIITRIRTCLLLRVVNQQQQHQMKDNI